MAQESFPNGTVADPDAAALAQPQVLHRLRESSAADQERVLLSLVRDEVAAALGQPSSGPASAPFRQLGVYGSIAARLRERLAAATDVRIPATLLFDYPTCAAVARFLGDALLRGGAAEVAAPVVTIAAGADDPIVIVGMGCRYAGGVHSPADLWRLVASGNDAITSYPTNRGWDVENLYDPDPDKAEGCCTQHAGFLHDAGDFDAAFFGISPREALGMDPQQRLLLEVAWEALESARIDPLSVAGQPGSVFMGVPYNHYGSALHKPAEGMHGYLLTGHLTSVASGRVAYSLGLQGPAVTVDTACSSSLVAMHLAVESLRRGECSLALAGGATVMSTPGVLMEFSRKRGLSPDGLCKAFSDDADGTGWGEGAAMLVLERLSDARAAGHRVLAVVRGTALNQDGASNGMTAPNGPAQQRVIRAALATAGLAAGDVDAVEAHGTGTPLGDPIEAQALLATYGQDRDTDHPLWLGSLKSNIGHTQGASGVGGVIKMVMAMRHGVLPETLHVSQPSSHVDWSAGAVRILTEAQPWPELDRPRRAGVSSFGVSGTNAHVILEEPSAEPTPEPAQWPESVLVPVLSPDVGLVPLVVSARGGAAVAAQAGRLWARLAEDPELNLADVGRSLLSTRALLPDRAVVIGTDTELIQAGLAAVAESELTGCGVVLGSADVDGKTVFVFPGQGAQWAGMALELLSDSPVFAARMAECEHALAPFVDWSVTGVLGEQATAPSLELLDVVQPVSWAVMVSLAALWQSIGIQPDAVVGHSQGEIAAACVAGILRLEDAARVVALRSQALSELTGKGGMLSVALPPEQVHPRLERWAGRLSVAAVNGPTSTVVSGDVDALDELERTCAADGVRLRRIEVDYASHCAHVEAIQERLGEALAGIAPVPGAIPMLSTVDGGWVAGPELDGSYWYRNLRQPVQFAGAVHQLAEEQFRVFVECSPHPVLTTSVQQTLDTVIDNPAVVTGSLRRGRGGAKRFLTSAAEAFVRGVDVDWTTILDPAGPLVDLPTYGFQRQRYWLDAPLLTAAADEPRREALDAAFWAAVREQDAPGLAQRLAVEPAALAAVLPALRTWHQARTHSEVVDSWRYRVSWQALPDPAAPVLTGTWLVVTPEHCPEPTTAVIAALAQHGATVQNLAVNPAELDRDTAATLLGEHLSTGPELAGVLSLLATDAVARLDHPVVAAGVAANLVLLQALGDAGVTAALWCATAGAVAVDDFEVLADTGQAATWGLGRVAALEYPQRWGGLIDLPAAADGLDPQTLVRMCAVLAGLGAEDQLAVRAGGLYTRRLVRARLGDTAPARAWRPRGTVLITGGTGALGAHVARWLAARGATRLVLTSRRGPGAPGSEQLVAELAALGTHASVVACDLADRDAVARLVGDLEISGHAIRSVVHTAGVAPLAALAELTVADLAAVAAGKVMGALHLDALLDHASLDAVVYFSSIAAVWGVGEHGSYAAANAQLDALAHQQRANGLPVHSVAWGPWAGGGMIADSLEDTLLRRGVPLIEPAPSIHALQQVLDHDEASVAVADVDWHRFASIFASARPSPLLNELPEVKTAVEASRSATSSAGTEASALVQRLTAMSDVERERTLVDLVRAHAARVLGHASAQAVDAQRAFMELGFDSLGAVDLRNGLNDATGLRLLATAVFDHPTPTLLARFIGEQLLGGARPDSAELAVSAPMDDDPIVIIGMACRYPGGVTSPEDLWTLVADGADVVSGLPSDRGWDLDTLYDPDPDHVGTSYTRSGGFLHDAADFDAGFFGISPREALSMDPQQRLVLEVAFDAVERARIAPASLKGTRTGVFVGMADQAYVSRLRGGVDGAVEGYLVTGGAASVGSGRISYALGLEGPALTVDTACSSSLVAMHLAVESLRRGECSLALAGAAMVMSTPAQFVGFSRQRGLAEDGRCKAFSDDADGFGLAEGAGMLVLERRSDARAAGHQVLAVVRGSALNQDGASNGLTAPNGASQQRVIRAALSAAGLTPLDVDAVEAHGTGTKLGDPIEAHALLATYGQGRDPEQPLWLGSVKSNIGHTQTASGVGGVIKMVLAMQHGVLPETLHVSEPSSFVDWSAGAVRVLTEPIAWPHLDRPRRAGVSSFGVSGTNAHVILEQAAAEPPAVARPATTEPALGPVPVLSPEICLVPIVVSGRSEVAVAAQAGRLQAWLAAAPNLDLADVGHSLLTSRTLLPDRAVVIGTDAEHARAGLAAITEGRPAAGVTLGCADVDGKTVFVFPGQGAQWAGMAVRLLADSPVFAARMAECEHALAPFVDWSVTSVLRDGAGAPPLERLDVVQPVSWAVMVSLAALWQSVGVTPDAVIGHSQGEIAAACVAGILSLRDGAQVVALRSQALSELAGHGGMLSVALPHDQVEKRLSPWTGRLSVAAVNGPTSVVVSGDVDALRELHADCVADEIRVRMIEVDYASHSVHVEAIEGRLADALAGIDPQPAGIAMLSTVDGDWVTGPELGAGYWYRNLRQPVEFAGAVQVLAAEQFRVFVECSSHPVLTTAVHQTLDAVLETPTVVVGSLRRDLGGAHRFLTSVAELFVRGVDVDWTAIIDPAASIVDLPTYAFQRQRYWLDTPQATATGKQRTIGETVDSWRYRVSWQRLPEPATAQLTGTWLVVSAEPAPAITAALAEHGATVQSLVVNPAELDRDTATALLLGVDPELTGVLALLADDRPHRDHPVLSAGLTASVALMQALGDADVSAPLWCATSAAVSVHEADLLEHPLQAQIWGLGIVAGLDDAQRWGGLVDLPAGTDGQPPDAAALTRMCAVLAGIGDEDQVAVRDSGVFGRRLVRARLGDAMAARTWRPRGTVLITGGTGALGAHVARWLATNGATRLVLTSRRGLHAPGAPELLSELAGLGAHASVITCDLADRAAAEAMLSDAQADGPLSAVVHAAGVPGIEAPLGETTLGEMAAVLAAKVAGAAHLDELLARTPLDAFVMFSSGAGVWGNVGQSAYAAANAYLEALAHHRRGRGLAATCVSWGAWDGGGMVGAQETQLLARHGILTMAPAHAIAGLAQALDHDDTALVVADIDWARFAGLYTMSGPRPLLDELAEANPEPAGPATETPNGSDLGARLTALSSDERQRELLRLVRTQAAGTLGHDSPDEVRASRPFRELGFDSLTAVDLRNQLCALTGLRLAVSAVFDHPTPAALARHLASVLVAAHPVTTGSTRLVPLDALDQLEPSLAALDPDADVRRQVTQRLRGLLRRWEQATDDQSDATELAELAAVTDDDMFELIDRELDSS